MNDPTPQLPATEQEYVAQRLSEQLGDPEGYFQFLSLTRDYPLPVLLELLHQVLAIPKDRIKNRAAVFNWRLQKRYGRTRKKHEPQWH